MLSYSVAGSPAGDGVISQRNAGWIDTLEIPLRAENGGTLYIVNLKEELLLYAHAHFYLTFFS